MLKVYNVSHYVSVDDGKWYRVGCGGGKAMFEDSKPKETIVNKGSFEAWYEYLQNHSLDGIYCKTTFFKKKPCIITYSSSYDSYARYVHFQKLSYKTVYKEWEWVPLTYIMDHFPADQAIQYLKERGMNICPKEN